jgi:hypothetical protein
MQNLGLKRNTIDKYYTKPIIAEQCVNLIIKHLDIMNDDLIIEPSAGNGSFIPYIKQLTNNYKFYDLEPENEEIIKQDFLTLKISKLSKIHIIGNPPFGRQSSLAIKFIKKCCEFGDTISFILPKSFKKDSMKKYFNSNYHLEYEEDIPDNSFLVNHENCDVPCVFQIWVLKSHLRETKIKEYPNQFIFVKHDNNPDISFRRVGVNAGLISIDTNKSPQSHYFIKFINNNTINENIDKLKNIKFKFNNTVGPKSISKQELIHEFNKYLY